MFNPFHTLSLYAAKPAHPIRESMPTSWSASCGSSAALCCHSSTRRGSRGTVFLFPDLQRRTDSLESQGTISVELNILDEVSEGELSPAMTTTLQPPGCSQAPLASGGGGGHIGASEPAQRAGPQQTTLAEVVPTNREHIPTGGPIDGDGKRTAAADWEGDPTAPLDHSTPDQRSGEDAAASQQQEPDSDEGSRDANALHHNNQVRWLACRCNAVIKKKPSTIQRSQLCGLRPR